MIFYMDSQGQIEEGLSKQNWRIRSKKVNFEQKNAFHPKKITERPPDLHLACLLYHSDIENVN